MQAVLLYDGRCIVCRQSMKLVRRLDWRRQIEPVDSQNQPVVTARFPDLTYEQLMGAVHVVDRNGQVRAGFFALRYMARFLPLLWVILPLLYLPGMNWLGPLLYRQIARRRYALNRFLGHPLCDDGFCKIA